jgi:hypothetical protein
MTKFNEKDHNTNEFVQTLEGFGFGTNWEATDIAGHGWTANLPNGRRVWVNDDTFDGFGYFFAIREDTGDVCDDSGETFIQMDGVKTLGSILAEGANVAGATPVLSAAGYEPSDFEGAYRVVEFDTYNFKSRVSQ